MNNVSYILRQRFESSGSWRSEKRQQNHCWKDLVINRPGPFNKDEKFPTRTRGCNAIFFQCRAD